MRAFACVLAIALALAACKKKEGGSEACEQRRRATAATIELAMNELAKLERDDDAAYTVALRGSDASAAGDRHRARKQQIQNRRDLLVQWSGALAGTKATAIEAGAGGGDDAPPSFTSARTMMIDFLAACSS